MQETVHSLLLTLVIHRLPNDARRKRHSMQTFADGRKHCIPHRRRDRENAALAHSLGTVRSRTAFSLHDESFECRWKVVERRQPIIDEAAIDELTILINEIFEQR